MRIRFFRFSVAESSSRVRRSGKEPKEPEKKSLKCLDVIVFMLL